jgi:hypothetical protein
VKLRFEHVSFMQILEAHKHIPATGFIMAPRNRPFLITALNAINYPHSLKSRSDGCALKSSYTSHHLDCSILKTLKNLSLSHLRRFILCLLFQFSSLLFRFSLCLLLTKYCCRFIDLSSSKRYNQGKGRFSVKTTF